eukprot:2544101-Pyramimonas_sp.AAC.1
MNIGDLVHLPALLHGHAEGEPPIAAEVLRPPTLGRRVPECLAELHSLASEPGRQQHMRKECARAHQTIGPVVVRPAVPTDHHGH